MDQIFRRLDHLEFRSKRNHEHLLTVIGGQRERFDRAFDEMKLAWLQQEVAIRSYAHESREQTRELRDTMEELACHVDQRLTRLKPDPPPAA